MDERNRNNELFQTAHILILISYTLFSFILIAESLILGWEGWIIALVLVSIAVSWVIHLRQMIHTNARLWIYSLLMMLSYFFYGTHVTSTFDICAVMLCVLILVTMTGKKELTYLCQGTFLLTFAYDIISMLQERETFDALIISRSILHITLILVTGWVSRIIIDKWSVVSRNAQTELEERQHQIEKLNDVLANVSHEIRTPINTIIGLTQFVMKEDNSDETQKNLACVARAGQNMSGIIESILDYSEIEMKRLVVNAENYMISSLINDIVAEMAPKMRKQVEFVIGVDPDVPAVMNTDVGKLKKILKHLIDNAFKYTVTGGIYIHITAQPRDYGINLGIEVTDTGIGMSPSELEEACEHFYQSDSGRTRYTGGLGLGMSIVSGFVKSLNGFLVIESEQGKGTTVRVSIPQKVVDRQSCMSLKRMGRTQIGVYLNVDKYSEPQVGMFYDSVIHNLTLGLKEKIERANDMPSLIKLLETQQLTHLFVGQEEYEEDTEFMRNLANEMQVIVVADDTMQPVRNPHIYILKKPFYCFPVISLLNAARGEEDEKEETICAKGFHALVVDDEPLNHKVASGIFKGYGMTADAVFSGKEAIEAVSGKSYDIIFMDHMMPEMDGVETMKHIKKQLGGMKKHIPVIALTANAVSTAREMFIEEGFDGFIAKPIEISELERVLKKVLPQSVSGTKKDYEQDAEGTKENTKDGLEQLEKRGVDIQAGLMYCQKDEGLYKDILMVYAEEAVERTVKLRDYLEKKDFKNYEILIHAIKSSSKMIGAMHLFRMAKGLEEAAEACNEDKIQQTHEKAMGEYLSLSEEIFRLFKQSGSDSGSSASQDGKDGVSDFEIFMEFEVETEGGEE